MGIRLLKNTAPATEPAEISDREYWQQEKKKAIWDLLIFFAAVVIVAIAVGTAAWFASNREVSGDNMQISMETPEYVQISPGKTTDVVLNAQGDLLVLSNSGAVSEPDVSSDYDWSNYLDVSNYYCFGKLIPASSVSGEQIIFTPDAVQTGRELKGDARFIRADGKTDNDLRQTAGKEDANDPDTDSLMASTYAYRSQNEKNEAEYWTGYRGYTKWYNTNDDGYYVDIPIWLRSNAAEDVPLTVQGYVTRKDGSILNDEDPTDEAIYKAVRIAILTEAGEAAAYKADSENEDSSTAHNIIPLTNGVEGDSILDSYNYTVTRDTTNTRDNDKLFGLQMSGTDPAVVCSYQEYKAYDKDNDRIIKLIAPDEDSEWGRAEKLIVRTWLDGEDMDCWNETAGQDWCICLSFLKTEEAE